MKIFSKEGKCFEIKDTLFLGLLNTPSQEDLREDQYALAKQIYNSSNGLISCPTGWGKSYLMVYLCKYLPKPILLTAPMNSIIEEFESRFKSKNINYSKDLKVKADVYLANPTGLASRKEFEGGVYNDTLRSIKTILVDECMNITSSLRSILDKLITCNRYFGFSATLDKFTNEDLSRPKNYKLYNITCEILEVFGRAFEIQKFNKILNIIHSKVPICNANIKYRRDQGQFSIDYYSLDRLENSIYNNPNFILYLVDCYNYAKSTIFVPYKNQQHVDNVLTSSLFKDLRVAKWNSNGLWIGKDKIEGRDRKHPLNPTPYQRLKGLVRDNEIDIVFVSAVSKMGVDFPELRNIVLINNSSSGIVLQFVGRATRGEYVNVFLPENSFESEVYDTQYKKRLKWVESLGEHNDITL